jgi:hypothetical protein
MATEVTVPSLFIAGFAVEYLNGDESYVVTVYYKDANGNSGGIPDKFSFSTSAKLKKFITKTLLGDMTPEEQVAGETS